MLTRGTKLSWQDARCFINAAKWQSPSMPSEPKQWKSNSMDQAAYFKPLSRYIRREQAGELQIGVKPKLF